MNAEKFTQKTIETINTAQAMAQENGNQYLTPAHLLYALIDQDGGLIGSLLGKMGADCDGMLGELDAEIRKLPRVSGGNGEVYASPETSKLLRFAEKAAEKLGGYDLLICGRHATDAETAQTGPIIAAFLGIPQVTLCGEVEIEDGWALCERLLPDRTEKVRVKLPALITVCAEANEPRYPTPIGIMKALKKPRHVWNAADLGCEPDMIGIPGSPSINKRVFAPPKRNTDTKYYTGSVEEMAKAIVDTLEAERLI